MYSETIASDHGLVVVLERDKACEKTLNINEDESYLFALKFYEQLNRSSCECEKKQINIINQ